MIRLANGMLLVVLESEPRVTRALLERAGAVDFPMKPPAEVVLSLEADQTALTSLIRMMERTMTSPVVSVRTHAAGPRWCDERPGRRGKGERKKNRGSRWA